mgnify:CR=1 FL=1
MSGKAKIEGHTNSWYGFAVFTAVCSVLASGIGVFSIVTNVAGMLFSWFVTFIIGRALIKRSSLTRLILLVATALFTIVGTLGVGKAAWMFVQTWQLKVLAGTVYGAVATWMYARSFRTLIDGSVKAYFR